MDSPRLIRSFSQIGGKIDVAVGKATKNPTKVFSSLSPFRIDDFWLTRLSNTGRRRRNQAESRESWTRQLWSRSPCHRNSLLGLFNRRSLSSLA